MTLTRNDSGAKLTGRFTLAATTLSFTLVTGVSALALRPNPSSAPAQAVQATTPVRISGAVMAEHVKSRVEPVYPPEAKAAHITGSVVLDAHLNADGTVKALKVISGPPELRQSALDAVQQWTYQPLRVKGVATEVNTTVTLNYNLHS